MNPLAMAASPLVGLVLALVLCLWAVVAVTALAATRLVAAAVGALGDGVRDLARPRR